MLLASSLSGRSVSSQLYRHLLRPTTPFIFERSISITRSHQTHARSIQCFTDHNELLDVFDRLLRRCGAIQKIKEIHSQIMITRGAGSAFLAARLVSVYARFGLLDDARKVFEAAPVECIPNLLLWNSFSRANVSFGEYEETLRLYLWMRKLGVPADGFTFPLVIRACALAGDSKLCKMIHCHVLQMGFRNHLHAVNELLLMYGKIGLMNYARRLFDRMPSRNHISWNTMVSAFALNYDSSGASEIFCRMEAHGWEPNPVTWTSLLSSYARSGLHKKTLSLYGEMRKKGTKPTAEALSVVISVCNYLGMLEEGMVIHGYVTRGGFDTFSFVKNSLICMYGKHGAVGDAETLFSELELKNIVSWNTLISSYAESGLCDEAFVTLMRLQNVEGNAMERPNVVSWTAVIRGFASGGRYQESVELFRLMQLAEVMANPISISSVLSACAELSALRIGKEIHAYATRSLVDKNNLVGNSLINMYMKCGCLKEGQLAFENIDGRDLFSWNIIIAGYGIHGLGEDALKLFDQMVEAGYKPDRVTFVALLSACSHAGLANEGHQVFSQMTDKFGIEPMMEHYACMVDLLGRVGLLQEAYDFIKNMPIEPNAYVLGALMNSCRVHKSTHVAEEIASQIFNLNSEQTGSYMLMSNMYAASGRWDDSARVRLLARVKGLKKTPGQSWIEVEKKVNAFSAGNMGQRGMDQVYLVLENLSFQMEMLGYATGKCVRLQNVDEKHLDLML